MCGVAGGFDDNAPLKCVECFDPEKNAWQSLAPMLSSRGGVGLACLGGKLYAVGKWWTSRKLEILRNKNFQKKSFSMFCPIPIGSVENRTFNSTFEKKKIVEGICCFAAFVFKLVKVFEFVRSQFLPSVLTFEYRFSNSFSK